MNKIRASIYALLFITLLVSSYITYLVYTNKTSGFCLTKEGSCANVLNSNYRVVFGLKLSLISLLWFSLLSIFFMTRRYKILYKLSIISAVFASYFIFLQIFVLKTICLLCMVVDVSVMAVFLLLFFYIDKIYKYG